MANKKQTFIFALVSLLTPDLKPRSVAASLPQCETPVRSPQACASGMASHCDLEIHLTRATAIHTRAIQSAPAIQAIGCPREVTLPAGFDTTFESGTERRTRLLRWSRYAGSDAFRAAHPNRPRFACRFPKAAFVQIALVQMSY